MKGFVWVLGFLLASTLVAAFAGIDRASVDVADRTMYAHVSVDANDQEDLTVTLFIPELGLRLRQGPFEDDDDFATTLEGELPWYADDVYLARIVVRNDHGKKVLYRPVVIG
ncbi:hypothetical protein HY493_05315 [Candidatus Woesearchaeota archaeon]|nr:hypothetical protein [Candidatus Woesearchaeota archaeon]